MDTKNYMINDKWLDLDKQNIVELQSVDGVLDNMKVNGSEIVTPSGKITITENGTDINVAQYATADVSVEGGGGSSDFSTAEVTIIAGDAGIFGLLNFLPILENEGLKTTIEVSLDAHEQITKPIVLYKGKTIVGSFGFYTVDSMSGNITIDDDDYYIITGDCSITLLPED